MTTPVGEMWERMRQGHRTKQGHTADHDVKTILPKPLLKVIAGVLLAATAALLLWTTHDTSPTAASVEPRMIDWLLEVTAEKEGVNVVIGTLWMMWENTSLWVWVVVTLIILLRKRLVGLVSGRRSTSSVATANMEGFGTTGADMNPQEVWDMHTRRHRRRVSKARWSVLGMFLTAIVMLAVLLLILAENPMIALDYVQTWYRPALSGFAAVGIPAWAFSDNVRETHGYVPAYFALGFALLFSIITIVLIIKIAETIS